MYPGFATQYLRQMRDFRFADYDAVARDAHTGIGARSPHEHEPDRPSRQQAGAISTILSSLGDGCGVDHATSSRLQCRSCSTPWWATHAAAAASGEYRIDDLGAAGGDDDAQHPRYRTGDCCTHAARRQACAVQRHPPHPVAADHRCSIAATTSHMFAR